MNLEIGKTYETRNGSLVTIEHEKGDPYYPFFGKVLISGTLDRIAYFSPGGNYNRMRQSGFDIIRESN